MQIVPQYVDVEDKIAGPFTWKSLGWMFAGGGMLVIAYTLFDRITFFIIAIPIILLTAAFAFYRPNGMSFIQFVGYGFNFLFRPKIYVWQREVEKKPTKKQKKPPQITTTSTKKQLTTDDVVALAQTLDSGGKKRSERIEELIKENARKMNKK